MKKLLPPYLFVLTVFAMGAVCWYSNSPHLITMPYSFLGLLFVAFGIALAGRSSALFRKVGTNIMTFDEPGKLVTTGAFKFTRNPMYLGFSISLFGFAVLFGAAISSFLLVVFYVVVSDRWYIAYEEREMIKKFGEEYSLYRNSVRRWI
ncbi:isoprenylcysteine carboxylmethyltransferase family protein [Vibrio penaeicida]|uniref:methyltransferase family protein n=1 Tax=Vibrio penaeicida TaxID=104609 RepID=UPI00273673B9|nr:isoprenylcysteine carboxylmethyltransferase family protein [Vibrio penaeicida]MDP2573475.1 isoprenylcysteine carboxylmethyltransferase family protein [Vibrio penaeicida]